MEGGVSDKATEKAPDLASLKKMFEEATSLTADARRESRTDQDYYDGVQWTADERRVLRKRKQPDLVFNRVRPAVNGTLGVIKQGATDPKAYPRNPQDEDSADVASKVLRFIADKNDFDARKIDCATDYLVQGTCAAIIEATDDHQVTFEQIRWEEFFYDPRSRANDFRDARFMGVAKWMYADEVKAAYPKAEKTVEDSLAGGLGMADETFEDRPSDGGQTVAWVDRTKRRVMVVELYHREAGTWRRCVFHAGGLLDYSDSPYMDEKGRPECPIVAQSCYVDRENNRFGIVRDMRGPQDEINKRRSKLLHLLNSRQLQAPNADSASIAMAVDKDVARTEAGKPDGVIPPGYVVVPTSDLAAGHANLLAEAKAEIERMAPSPAVIGRDSESQSGRATLVRQQAGMTEQAIVFGGIEDWELRVYRQKWNRARQYMTAPDFVRITDDQGSPEFVGINQPVPGPPQVVLGPNNIPMLQPTVLGYENSLAELDMDIVIDTVPDTANIQQEQFQALAELAKIYGPQEVSFDDLLEVSTMPNKRALIEKRKARAQEGQQDPNRQLQMQGMAAEVQKTQAEADLTKAKTVTELQKPQLDALSALQAMQRPAAGV
jgi:hypothetical protein